MWWRVDSEKFLVSYDVKLHLKVSENHARTLEIFTATQHFTTYAYVFAYKTQPQHADGRRKYHDGS